MIQVHIEKYFKRSSLNLSFENKNNRSVIIGPSGSGKSLLLKLIAGFFQPDRGEIVVNGEIFYSSEKKINLPIHQRQIGYLPQEYTLFPNMTVRENILYAVKTRKMKIAPKEFDSLMERFGLKSHLDDYPHNLSGGQKQRAALARLLLIKPRLMLLDEPFSALDTPIRESLRELVMEEVDRDNIPALFVTHDTEEAFVFGKELVLVEKGQVVESGCQENIFNFPSFVETAHRLGFSNIWPIEKKEGDCVIIPNGAKLLGNYTISDKVRFVCIRPENVMILRDDSKATLANRDNVFHGKLHQVHNRGRYLRLEFEGDNKLKLSIHIPDYMYARLDLYKGKPISVSIKKDLVVLCESKTR